MYIPIAFKVCKDDESQYRYISFFACFSLVIEGDDVSSSVRDISDGIMGPFLELVFLKW